MTIFYIDPQSIANLSAYDYGVLSEIKQPSYYFCSQYYDYRPMETNVRKCPIFRYNHCKNKLVKLLSYLFSMLRLLLYTIVKQPQIIHVQWFRIPHFDYVFYGILKHVSHAKLIYTAHNVLPHNTGSQYQRVYHKAYHQLFDYIIVHAQSTKQEIHEQFRVANEKIIIIHHGILQIQVDEEKLKNETTLLDEKYKTDGCLIFASLGEQSPYKGIDLLVEAWKSTPLLNDNPNIKLIIAGLNNGIDFSPLASFKNVEIVNEFISNEEFVYLLRHTDVYLLPYRNISQSGALFTALAEHVPLLVSDVGGLAEPLRIADIGWIIKKESVQDLQQQLTHLVNHVEDIDRTRNNSEGWEKVCNEYSWSQISHQTAKLYQQAV